jgi:hypothetical protein
MTTVMEAFAGVAAQAVAGFAGRNGRVRGSVVVHAVHTEKWLADIRVPAPACRIGVAGFDLSALVPTDDPISCARCLHTGHHSTVTAAGPQQLALWETDPAAGPPIPVHDAEDRSTSPLERISRDGHD